MSEIRKNRTLPLLALLVVTILGSILVVVLTRPKTGGCVCPGSAPTAQPHTAPGRIPPAARPPLDNPSPGIDAESLEWLKRLHDWYYPGPNTQGFEEIFIRDFFRDKPGGVFVDIGASHYRVRSTTYYLEMHLGWSGLAVDALAEYADAYEKHRKKTKFCAVYVGDKTDAEVDFNVIKSNKRLSSSSDAVGKEHVGDVETIKVKTITMNDLLAANGITRFDLLSMDIELAEPAALRGFDIDRYKPMLVVIESHDEVDKEIKTYFTAHRYSAIEPYSRLDPLNDYYVPAEQVAAFDARMAEESAMTAPASGTAGPVDEKDEQ